MKLIQDILKKVGTSIEPLIAGDGLNSMPIGQTTPAAGKFTQLKQSKGSDVASANALVLGVDGNYFDIIGTTAITSIGTLGIGTFVTLHFDGILTLTHHSTNLILPSAANITTAAGDEAVFFEYDAEDWRCVVYSRADGTSLIASGLANVIDDTTPQLGGDLEYNEQHQVFDRTLASDNVASGDIIDVTFGETVVFGQLCYPDATDNEWKLALATNAAVKHPAFGIALESKGNGEVGKLLLRGTIRDASYFSSAVMGDIVYLSDGTPGAVVYAAPSDTGDIVQIVGFGLENNYIFFDPDKTYIEVA